MTGSDDKSKKFVPQHIIQKVPWSDIRKQMITSLGVAFGALIGFMWTGVVQQAFVAMGVIISGSVNGWAGWVAYACGAIVVTFVAVIMMLVIARSQAKPEEKKT